MPRNQLPREGTMPRSTQWPGDGNMPRQERGPWHHQLPREGLARRGDHATPPAAKRGDHATPVAKSARPTSGAARPCPRHLSASSMPTGLGPTGLGRSAHAHRPWTAHMSGAAPLRPCSPAPAACPVVFAGVPLPNFMLACSVPKLFVQALSELCNSCLSASLAGEDGRPHILGVRRRNLRPQADIAT